MKKFLPSFARFLIIFTAIAIVAGVSFLAKDQPIVRAFGDLIVTFPSTPFFSETNLAPSDAVTKPLTVNNAGTVSRMVAVRASAVSRTPAGPPDLDDALTLEIREGFVTLYGPSPLKNFLDDSDGVILNVINPAQTKNYTFDVVFPAGSGNEFQARNVEFDLHVGYIIGSNVVINEAFINVDAAHGLDCPSAQGQCHEWVELFNPTNQDISLKNWQIADSSGVVRTINANKTIKANSFALLTKSNSEFARFWTVPRAAEVIELGQVIGNGLGNTGDRLRLLDPSGNEVDAISWGTDSYAPHYGGAPATGHSIERLAPGFDTDSGTDFTDLAIPTPGQ